MKKFAFYNIFFRIFAAMKMLALQSACLQMLLHHPEDGFYRGTRFDHAGVWDSLLFRGVELCGRWFPSYDPFMHDAVCGPAEEFSPVFLEGGRILKIGVGLLQADGAPYDRFKLYPVLDGGQWTVEAGPSSVRFFHRLPGFYEYEKTVALTGEASFEIRHALRGSYQGEVYNHNFFTMGKMAVGPSRLVDFPFTPAGTWRAQYDSVGFTDSGVRFYRPLQEGESVYCGNIHAAAQAEGTSPSASFNWPKSAECNAPSALPCAQAEGTSPSASYNWPKSAEGDVPSAAMGMPYRMSLAEGAFRVSVEGSVPVSRTVLWANHRIACLEPYNTLSVRPAAPDCWTLCYEIDTIDTQ